MKNYAFIISYFLFPLWGMSFVVMIPFSIYSYGFLKGISFILYYMYSPFLLIMCGAIFFGLLKMPFELLESAFNSGIKRAVSLIKLSFLSISIGSILYFLYSNFLFFIEGTSMDYVEEVIGFEKYIFHIINFSYEQLGFSTTWMTKFLKLFQVSVFLSAFDLFAMKEAIKENKQ